MPSGASTPSLTVEQHLPAADRERQIAELVEDDEIDADELVGQFPCLAGTRLGLELIDQVDRGEEPNACAVAHAIVPDCYRYMALAGAGAADQYGVALGGQEPAAAPMLLPIAERAERILQELESRNTTGLAAMDYLAALANEKEEAVKGAQYSGLSARAFGVYWSLKEDEALAKAGISPVALAKEAETLLARFPNARVNDDEHRRLRAALYRPLLGLDKEDRGRIVETVLTILLDGGSDDERA